MLRILSILSVTNCIYSAVAFHGCHRMRPLRNIQTNFTECEMKRFLHPVPTYFCIQFCNSLPDCSAVTMEMGEMTSWCCAYKMIPGDMSVCHGNYTLIHLPNMKLLWQNDQSCSGNISPGTYLDEWLVCALNQVKSDTEAAHKACWRNLGEPCWTTNWVHKVQHTLNGSNGPNSCLSGMPLARVPPISTHPSHICCGHTELQC